MLKINSCSRKLYVGCFNSGGINLLCLHVYVHYHYKTKLPACIWPYVQMCVDGTALPFQVDPVLFQNPPLPYSLKLLRNVTWLNTAVCHFIFESQTRQPVNTMFPSLLLHGQ